MLYSIDKLFDKLFDMIGMIIAVVYHKRVDYIVRVVILVCSVFALFCIYVLYKLLLCVAYSVSLSLYFAWPPRGGQTEQHHIIL